jgi:FAD-dependent oxidoreductase domain-containing protein 1
VRATWWQPVNVSLCAATIEGFRAAGEEVGFRPEGYLWLYGPGLWPEARDHVAMQNRYGREVELLTPRQASERRPVVDVLDGIAGATHSPRDGLVSPDAVRERFRRRARAAGARFVDRRLVVGADRRDGRVRSVRVAAVPDEAAAHAALEDGAAPPAVETWDVDRVVNAAGPWASVVAPLLGYTSPTFAVPRQICLAATTGVDLTGLGMVVDTSGVYLHEEAGGTILSGYSPPGDPPSRSFRYEGEAFFEREVWPRLAARMTALDRLRYMGGWTGLYDMSPDCSACLGAVAGLPGVYEIHSFSGRGVMQSDGAALALAELMTEGRFLTEPLAALLDAARFRGGGPLQPEELHI